MCYYMLLCFIVYIYIYNVGEILSQTASLGLRLSCPGTSTRHESYFKIFLDDMMPYTKPEMQLRGLLMTRRRGGCDLCDERPAGDDP